MYFNFKWHIVYSSYISILTSTNLSRNQLSTWRHYTQERWLIIDLFSQWHAISYKTFPRTHLKTRKSSGTAENPALPQILLCDIQIDMLPANVCLPYRSIVTPNLSDLDFDLSKSLKVKSDGAVGLTCITC